jgi:hypothetical protein
VDRGLERLMTTQDLLDEMRLRRAPGVAMERVEKTIDDWMVMNHGREQPWYAHPLLARHLLKERVVLALPPRPALRLWQVLVASAPGIAAIIVLVGALFYLSIRPELVWSLGQRAMMRQVLNERVKPECLR